MKSQSVTSSSGGGGRRYPPYAFTEQGVAMLPSLLRSKRAVEVNVEISFTAWVEGTPPPGTQVLFWAKRSAPLDKGSFVQKKPLTASETGREYRFTEELVSTSGGSVWVALGVEAVQDEPVTVHFGQVHVRVTS